MNWGKSIVLAFVLFALFIGILVIVCLRQDIPLVSSNYYEQELRFQEQLDRMKNTESLQVKPEIQVVNGVVELQYDRLDLITQGELELFRPSDARWDKRFTIKPQGRLLRFEPGDLPGGMYKARLRWTEDGRDHFLERTIYL